MLHLVRHASAGDRFAWEGADFLRPLDGHGRAQAEAIGAELAQGSVKRILSSPAVRCVETVEPLGRLVGLAVETVDELVEGADRGRAFKMVHSLAAADGDAVLCSHGDVIPGVLWMLARCGVDIGELGRCKKASIWDLEVRDGGVVGAAYRPPSTFGAA